MSSAAIIPDQGLDVVQHPSLGTLKFPKEMPPDERNASIIRLMAQQPKSSQSAPSSYVQSLASGATSIGPQEKGTSAFLDRLYNQVKGALSGGGRPDAAVPVLGGAALGPIRLVKGVLEFNDPAAGPRQRLVRGTNDIVGGTGQTLALPMAVANPGTMAYATPSVVAQSGTQAALQSLGANPENAELGGNLAGIVTGGAVARPDIPVKVGKTVIAASKPLGKLPVIDHFIKAIQAAQQVPGEVRNIWNIQPKPEVIPPGPKMLPAGPTELPSSTLDLSGSQQGVLPAASRITPSGKVQYLTRPLNPGESPAVPKDVNTQSQSALIDAIRQRFNQQTETESPFQTADRRMAETAKTPFDRATPKAATPQFAYRSRNAGETGIIPRGKAQASLDPSRVSDYMEGRGAAENHPQELVKVDLSKLDPSEYTVHPNGYVEFKSAVPESFIEKMGSKAISDATPRVPTSSADMLNLLQQSLAMVRSKAQAAKAGK